MTCISLHTRSLGVHRAILLHGHVHRYTTRSIASMPSIDYIISQGIGTYMNRVHRAIIPSNILSQISSPQKRSRRGNLSWKGRVYKSLFCMRHAPGCWGNVMKTFSEGHSQVHLDYLKKKRDASAISHQTWRPFI